MQHHSGEERREQIAQRIDHRSTYLCELGETRLELLVGCLAQSQLHHFVLAEEESRQRT